MKTVDASAAERDLHWWARVRRWLSVPQTSHFFKTEWREPGGRHGDEAHLHRRRPCGGVAVPAVSYPEQSLILRDNRVCCSQTPKVSHRKLRARPPSYFLPPTWSAHRPLSFFPRSLTKHKDFSFCKPCTHCSLQANMEGMILPGARRLSSPWSWSFTSQVSRASSFSSFTMFLPSLIPTSRRKSSI